MPQGARSIVAKEGIGGLYHGLLPTLLRDVPDIAIQFTLYERLRRMLERRRNVTKLRTWEHLILGGFSGLAPFARQTLAVPCRSDGAVYRGQGLTSSSAQLVDGNTVHVCLPFVRQYMAYPAEATVASAEKHWRVAGAWHEAELQRTEHILHWGMLHLIGL